MKLLQGEGDSFVSVQFLTTDHFLKSCNISSTSGRNLAGTENRFKRILFMLQAWLGSCLLDWQQEPPRGKKWATTFRVIEKIFFRDLHTLQSYLDKASWAFGKQCSMKIKDRRKSMQLYFENQELSSEEDYVLGTEPWLVCRHIIQQVGLLAPRWDLQIISSLQRSVTWKEIGALKDRLYGKGVKIICCKGPTICSIKHNDRHQRYTHFLNGRIW